MGRRPTPREMHRPSHHLDHSSLVQARRAREGRHKWSHLEHCGSRPSRSMRQPSARALAASSRRHASAIPVHSINQSAWPPFVQGASRRPTPPRASQPCSSSQAWRSRQGGRPCTAATPPAHADGAFVGSHSVAGAVPSHRGSSTEVAQLRSNNTH